MLNCGMTVRLRFAVCVWGVGDWSVTLTVKFVVPAAVGVPEIAPVLACSDRPAGNEPVDTLHV